MITHHELLVLLFEEEEEARGTTVEFDFRDRPHWTQLHGFPCISIRNVPGVICHPGDIPLVCEIRFAAAAFCFVRRHMHTWKEVG